MGIKDTPSVFLYDLASVVYHYIMKDDCDHVLYYFLHDEMEEIKLFKAQKKTLLHDFISSVCHLQLEMYIKHSDDSFEDIDELLIEYGLDIEPFSKVYERLERLSLYEDCHDKIWIICWKNHQDLLYGKYTNVLETITEEAFSLLFENRAMCRRFHEEIAEIVLNNQSENHESNPNAYDINGLIKRQSSWPDWLKKGLKIRDKGRCVICKKDVTSIYNNEAEEMRIDHVIPISKGGNNDPTNLQLLCFKCNSDKSNKNNDTRNTRFQYFT